ncbi:MAG TPA: DUF4147 domain-containing protein [Thermoanaerobaculia bacterium]|nr:DUF4147 domain-containing protein [Thermoanaerobaculia bacterium]
MPTPTGSYTSIPALRQVALGVFRAGLQAADPVESVRSCLRSNDADALFAEDRWALLAVGKAARGMALGARSVLSVAPVAGVVVEPKALAASRRSGGDRQPVPVELRSWPLVWRRGSHPLPDRGSQLAARAFERCAATPSDAGGAERFLALLSGGASALLAAPTKNITLADKVRVTELLLRAGASIGELNAVRKHLSRLKGGGLARLVAPRPATVLVLSDVPDDDLSVIGSGPWYPDPSTFAEAEAVLLRHGVYEQAPEAVRERLRRGARGQIAETPKPGDVAFLAIRHQVVATNACSVAAMAAEAERAGFEVAREERPVVGEARDAAEQWILALSPGPPRRVARVSGGETTVTVRGVGRGGRNQELALAFALLAERESERLAGRPWCFLSAGTDGVDGPTDAAGALVDHASLQRCRAAGVDPAAALADNDSYRALAAAGDLLRTGPTGTNVADLQVLLVQPG